jgi:hypothetical protein
MSSYICCVMHWKEGDHALIAETIANLRQNEPESSCVCKSHEDMRVLLQRCIETVAKKTCINDIKLKAYPGVLCMSAAWPGRPGEYGIMIATEKNEKQK